MNSLMTLWILQRMGGGGGRGGGGQFTQIGAGMKRMKEMAIRLCREIGRAGAGDRSRRWGQEEEEEEEVDVLWWSPRSVRLSARRLMSR